MRLRSIVLLIVISVQFNILLHNSVTNTFVTIPAWVAFGAITAAVKLKLILVKIMFALKTMGIGSIRFKRSFVTSSNEDSVLTSDNTELLEAWDELEDAAGRRIEFSLESCIAAVKDRDVEEILIKPRGRASTSTEISGYSKFVSSIIGSITGTKMACYILEDALRKRWDDDAQL